MTYGYIIHACQWQLSFWTIKVYHQWPYDPDTVRVKENLTVIVLRVIKVYTCHCWSSCMKLQEQSAGNMWPKGCVRALRTLLTITCCSPKQTIVLETNRTQVSFYFILLFFTLYNLYILLSWSEISHLKQWHASVHFKRSYYSHNTSFSSLAIKQHIQHATSVTKKEGNKSQFERLQQYNR